MGKEIIIGLKNCKIDREFHAKSGSFLADVLRQNGIAVSLSCGGNGRCGKCRAVFADGAPMPNSFDEKFLSKEELAVGKRLLCRCIVTDDCSVEIDGAVSDESMKVELTGAYSDGNAAAQIAGVYDSNGSSSCCVPDNKRVNEGKHISESAEKKYKEYAIVVDIGTTTLAAAILGMRRDGHGEHADVIMTRGMANPQRRFGADVITRIDAASETEDRESLENTLRQSIRDLVKELMSEVGAKRAEVVVITGNTTMLHFFAGEDTKGLGRFPYTPVFTDGKEIDPEVVFGEALSGTVILMPGISAFVGADIVSGLYFLDVISSKKSVLMADIGTNGELAFWDGHKLSVTSTAAGPVFEGGNISFGMASVPGAIDHVKINSGGAISFSVIGSIKPLGICGSGVIDIISELIRCGFVDETGLLAERYFDAGFPVDDSNRIFFTQQDIRQVQLAKGAIYSGIKAITGGEVPDRVYLAGGFGSSIDSDKIKNIRMFPDGFSGKIVLAGNTALAGAVRYAGDILLGQERKKTADECLYNIREKAQVTELARSDGFDEDYISSMNF